MSTKRETLFGLPIVEDESLGPTPQIKLGTYRIPGGSMSTTNDAPERTPPACGHCGEPRSKHTEDGWCIAATANGAPRKYAPEYAPAALSPPAAVQGTERLREAFVAGFDAAEAAVAAREADELDEDTPTDDADEAFRLWSSLAAPEGAEGAEGAEAKPACAKCGSVTWTRLARESCDQCRAEPSGERRELHGSLTTDDIVTLLTHGANSLDALIYDGAEPDVSTDHSAAMRAAAAALSDSGTGAAPPEGERKEGFDWRIMVGDREYGRRVRHLGYRYHYPWSEEKARQMFGLMLDIGDDKRRLQYRRKGAGGPWTDAEEGGEADG